MRASLCASVTNVMCCAAQELVVNWDQNDIHFIPNCGRDRAEKNSKEVVMIGGEANRQITGVFPDSVSGELLPPQLIFQGKTQQSLPPTHDDPDFAAWHMFWAIHAN